MMEGHGGVSRSTFVRRLKKIGEIEVPKGHVRRNKGITTHFFDASALPEVETLLRTRV